MLVIDSPEIEDLIQKCLLAGGFGSVEAVLWQALIDLPLPAKPVLPQPALTGAAIIAAFQACPVKDWDFEPARWWVTYEKPLESE